MNPEARECDLQAYASRMSDRRPMQYDPYDSDDDPYGSYGDCCGSFPPEEWWAERACVSDGDGYGSEGSAEGVLI